MEKFLGNHITLDMYGCSILINSSAREFIMDTLHDIILSTGATILHTHVHPFDEDGFSGIFVLAESHLSIHTWPELDYVSIDVYMCGDCNPVDTVVPIIGLFQPSYWDKNKMARGVESVAKRYMVS